VRGDKGTGKSTLCKMLCGGLFDAEYKASKPGSSEKSSIQWAAGPGEDVELTLEAVNDAAPERSAGGGGEGGAGGGGLKMVHDEGSRGGGGMSKKKTAAKLKEEAKLYEGCQGVIIMVNPTKEWTFSYAKDQLRDLPSNLEVLIVGNYRDDIGQWVTQPLAMQQAIAGVGNHAHYCETCLANMYGMPAVEAFLSIALQIRKVCAPLPPPSSPSPSPFLFPSPYPPPHISLSLPPSSPSPLSLSLSFLRLLSPSFARRLVSRGRKHCDEASRKNESRCRFSKRRLSG
jgi:GTPase SAR1 family protein